MKISKKTRHLAIYLFSVLALIAWVITQTPGLSPTIANSTKHPVTRTSKPSVQSAAKGGSQGPGALTKDQMTERLNELDGLISSLKTQLHRNPKNTALLSQLNSAINEYESLSAFMGGDQASPSNSSGSAPESQPEIERPIGSIVVPPGCTSATTTVTQSTPTAIPTGPAVVSSTVVVAGANAFTFDVNLTTNLTHTFAADLDITLTSPAGTVVTLTTDNGAGNDNVFNGTVWDDDANPAGQVPYVTNNGVVSDHAYVNLTTATPLVPEEAMGAFIGEDPNGTWTITISDDLAGDGGSLDSWTLEIVTATCAQPCLLTCPANITVSNDPNQCGAVVTYPPPTTTGTCGTITCSPASGSFFPVGTTTVTCTDSGGATCTFTVTVNDTQPPTITCAANVTTVTAVCGGSTGVVNFTAPTASDNCPGVTVACVPPAGSILPVGTSTVTCTATDAAGNTATCSFTVTLFNACLQDDDNPSVVLLWNTQTGAYRFCCNGTIFTGIGKVLNQGDSHSISHSAVDRRVNGVLDCATSRGQAGLQSNAGSLICTINDRDIRNNTCDCGGAPPAPVGATTK